VVVHIEQTRLHPEISAADLARAKPVRVLPESSAPQLPPGWDQAPAARTPARTANPRRLPAAVRRTVAASEAPAGSLDNFRILSFNHPSSKAKSPSTSSRRTISAEALSELSDLTESEQSDEELSDGPSTPYSSPSPRDAAEIATPVYRMTAEHFQLPVDFSSSKMQFGEMDVKTESSLTESALTWTWDHLTATNMTDHTKTMFTDSLAQELSMDSLFDNYDYDMFGQVERALPELIPGFGTTADLFGWDLVNDKLSLNTMAGAGLCIPDDVYYNPAAPSPKYSDFSTTVYDEEELSPAPVISALPSETFVFLPADYSMSPMLSPAQADSFDELFFNSIDSSCWNQLAAVDWEELSSQLEFQASS